MSGPRLERTGRRALHVRGALFVLVSVGGGAVLSSAQQSGSTGGAAQGNAAAATAPAAPSAAGADAALQTFSAAGADRTSVPGREELLSRSDELIARFDCLACHGPESALRTVLDPSTAPRLVGVTDRAHPDWIARFLADPRSLRPGTTHPHELIGLAPDERATVGLELSHYIARQDDIQPIEAAVETATVAELERGRALYHTVGCFVCHGARESVDDLTLSLAELATLGEEEVIEGGSTEAPDDAAAPLRPGVFSPVFTPFPADLADKHLPSGLASYLVDPVAARPSGHCPSLGLDAGEAEAIAAYVLMEQAQRLDGSFEARPGLVRESFELDEIGDDPLASIDSLVPVERETALVVDLAGAPRADRYALRFSGWLDVPEDGAYTFHLTSDDDARLTIDGSTAVDNPGAHAATTVSTTVELYAGERALVLDFVERTGDAVLELEWEGPGVPRGPLARDRVTHWPLEYRRKDSAGVPIPPARFAVDQRLAQKGERHFTRFGCIRCHQVEGYVERGEPGHASAPTLERLAGVRPGVLVCLRQGGRFDLQPEDAGALLSAFVDPGTIASDALVAERAVERTMVRRNCYGCHRRDGLGGVHPSIAPYFLGDEDAELGDEGRFPPTLDAVGRKLRPDVLDAAVHGHERVRPYLRVRMPRVGDTNVPQLATTLRLIDEALPSVPPLTDAARAACTPRAVDDGRRLAGVRGGLGCVQCHDFRGTESLGVRAVDLSTMHRRLRFDWFRELLLAPSNVGLEGRMANLWLDEESPVTGIADGDVEAQIQRIWCWLGEGDSMAPPPGLDTGPWAYEVRPDDRTRLVSVFMRGVSPRVVCVGTEAGVHSAFDIDAHRLALVWRGRFINVMGTWRGRAGQLEEAGSTDLFELSSGAAVLPRESLVAPWGAPSTSRAIGREVGEDGAVTFEYELDGVRVRETITPTVVAVPGGEPRSGVRRRVQVRTPPGGVGLSLVARPGVARRFDPEGRGVWRDSVDGWPLFRVLGDAARVARIARVTGAVDADARAESGATVRIGRGARYAKRTGAKGPPADEIRVPILLAPEPGSQDPRSAPLVGEVSWEFTW